MLFIHGLVSFDFVKHQP